jgi:hypothetical protein
VLLRVLALRARGNRSFIWFLKVLRATLVNRPQARSFRVRNQLDFAGSETLPAPATFASARLGPLFKLQNLHGFRAISECLHDAAVPELQKLLTFQHGNEGVGAMLALNDLGRDQLANNCKQQRTSRLAIESRSLRQSDSYI